MLAWNGTTYGKCDLIFKNALYYMQERIIKGLFTSWIMENQT